MNKIFSLIRVNFLSLFDINKIMIARSDGVKSNLEKKTIMTGVIAIIYGYLLYKLLIHLKLSSSIQLFHIGFLLSSLICLMMNIFIIDSTIFKSEDNEILGSMPLTYKQILFSKLFMVYLKNLLMVGIVMIASYASYINVKQTITDMLGLVVIISSFLIPIIPIILATLVSYINDYYKVKFNNNGFYKVGKVFIISIILLIIYYLLTGIDGKTISDIINEIINISYIYIFSYLFNLSIKGSIIGFIILILGNILFIYLYSLVVSNNYSKICSLLKGKKKNSTFKYHNQPNLGKFRGFVKKELINLFSNKFYLFSSYGVMVIFSIVLFIFLNMLDLAKFQEIEHFEIYLNLYVPTILAMLVTINNAAICAMSLEKENMEILRTMPLKMGCLLAAKWFVSVLVGSFFAIINGTLAILYLDLNKWGMIYSYLLPIVAIMFGSLISLTLDYRFIEKKELDDNSIIKGRFIGMVPSFVALVIGIGPFFIPPYRQYKLLLGSYVLILIIGQVICVLYLIIARKKLLSRLV